MPLQSFINEINLTYILPAWNIKIISWGLGPELPNGWRVIFSPTAYTYDTRNVRWETVGMDTFARTVMVD